MKKFLYIIIGIVALVSCKSDDDNTSAPVVPQQEVVNLNIDVILPNSVRKTLQPAIDDALSAIDNAQEKSAKRVKLNLRYHDEDTEDLTKLAYALANPGKGDAPYASADTCHAIIGPWHSDHARTILNQAQRLRLPVMMSCTSAELQRSEATQTNSFFMVESDITQCEVLLSSILRLGHSRVALLYSDDTYGQSYRDWFGFLATELSMEPVSGGIRSYHAGDNLNDYFSHLADQAAKAPVAVVVALGRSEDYPAVLEARKQFAAKNTDRPEHPPNKSSTPLLPSLAASALAASSIWFKRSW
jgi:ABC-type branched-subunit amino acid transport system substrate-binding protein